MIRGITLALIIMIVTLHFAQKISVYYVVLQFARALNVETLQITIYAFSTVITLYISVNILVTSRSPDVMLRHGLKGRTFTYTHTIN